jgi:hypothetical protein
MVHPYKGAISTGKGMNNSMAESQDNYMEYKKPDQKKYLAHNCTVTLAF